MTTCENCRFCIKQDEGYSNWTTTGTTIDCLKNKNDNFPVDLWFDDNEKHMKDKNNCDFFENGGCVDVDVEQDQGDLEHYSEYEDVKELLRNY